MKVHLEYQLYTPETIQFICEVFAGNGLTFQEEACIKCKGCSLGERSLIKHCDACRCQWYEKSLIRELWHDLNFCHHCGRQLRIFLETKIGCTKYVRGTFECKIEEITNEQYIKLYDKWDKGEIDGDFKYAVSVSGNETVTIGWKKYRIKG